ncbi:hypothetical protein GS447_07970 [Rhodococcus hoagii]|nr:hypothetical protein [Prescottella equi]
MPPTRSTGDDLPILVLTAVIRCPSGSPAWTPVPTTPAQAVALEELLARLRALLRRARRPRGRLRSMTFEDLTLDPVTRE